MRWIAIATLAFGAAHCKECSQTIVTVKAGAEKLGEIEAQRAADREACGGVGCEANQQCNYLYTPPRCSPTLLRTGDRCGVAANGRSYACDMYYKCEGPPGEMKCVGTPDGAPCRTVSNNIDPECERGTTCFADGKCHPACPGCLQPYEHCNTLYDPPRCFPNMMPVGTKCGRYDRRNGPIVFRQCAGVCGGKRGEQVCMPSVGEGTCGYVKCPTGMRCDADETCVPAEAK